MLLVQPEAISAPGRLTVRSPEGIVLGLIIGTQLLAFVTAFGLQREVNWFPFLLRYAAALGLIAIGFYVRTTKGKPRLGLFISGIGCLMAFPVAFSVASYSLMPLTNPMIDPQLTEIGRWFGYDWRTFLIAMMDYPVLSRVLGIVYQSSLAQLLLVILVLSATGRSLELYRFLFVGMVTLYLTIAIWWAWPSVGYVGVLPYTKDELLSIGFVFGPDRGGLLTRLLTEGPGLITPEVITGVVGFPSYHTVMLLLVTWYLRGTVAFYPILAVNLAMIPATLLHGGHHLVDLFGGLAVFVVVVLLAHRILPEAVRPGDDGAHAA